MYARATQRQKAAVDRHAAVVRARSRGAHPTSKATRVVSLNFILFTVKCSFRTKQRACFGKFWQSFGRMRACDLSCSSVLLFVPAVWPTPLNHCVLTAVGGSVSERAEIGAIADLFGSVVAKHALRFCQLTTQIWRCSTRSKFSNRARNKTRTGTCRIRRTVPNVVRSQSASAQRRSAALGSP